MLRPFVSFVRPLGLAAGQQPPHRFGPLGVRQRQPGEHGNRFGEVFADGSGVGFGSRVAPLGSVLNRSAGATVGATVGAIVTSAFGSGAYNRTRFPYKEEVTGSSPVPPSEVNLAATVG